MANAYQDVGGYSWASLRVGIVVRNPAGREIYVQPGDAETAMRETLEALEESTDGMTLAQTAMMADMALGDYFDA